MYMGYIKVKGPRGDSECESSEDSVRASYRRGQGWRHHQAEVDVHKEQRPKGRFHRHFCLG